MVRQRRSGPLLAWCLYDWANSAFTTLVVTFLYSAYFSENFAPDPGRGTALWSRGITVSALIIAGLAPIAGALADRGNRRHYLIGCSLVCVAATIALAFIRPDSSYAVVTALGVFVVANVAFEIAMVFYNAFLPSIARSDQMGRVSGYGWSLGYAGGLGALVIALAGFVTESPWFGMTTDQGFNLRATNLLVALWFLVFSLPAFIYLRDEPASVGAVSTRGVFSQIVKTVRRIRDYRHVSRFLLARLFYNDGLVTIFAFGGIYAVGTFEFNFSELIAFGIVINVGAGVGAFLFGFIDDRLGGKNTILLSVVALGVATLLGAMAPTRLWFWVSAVMVGIFAGPNQSASRSLMARVVPVRHKAEFFGLFAFSGKVTSFVGPLTLGLLADSYSQRVGVGSLVVFFVVGGALLWRVDEAEAIATTHRS